MSKIIKQLILLKNNYLILFMVVCLSQSVIAKGTELGAEVWIEPGNTKQQITEWIRLASESKLKDIRIFAMWSQIEAQPNMWNFDIYDWMFQACEKYKLKLQVTINSNQPPAFYGKEYWGRVHMHTIFSEKSIQPKSAEFIKRLVERYKDNPALENWWLMNEPLASSEPTARMIEGFRKEMKIKYKSIVELNKFWMSDFASFEEVYPLKNIYSWPVALTFYDWEYYCNRYLTEYQKWVRDEVYKYDTKHTFHTNPAGVFNHFHKQSTTDWKPFLNSLGASIHASFHFNILTREQYAMGVAATCEIVKSNAYPNPFWISEMQAGNNTFSGENPMCPMYSDIAQWTWTGIAQGADKIIYWLLNPRAKGNESGEWGLLNFLNEPSERLKAATDIANCMNNKSVFFDIAKPIDSKITILISPETNFTLQRKRKNNYEGLDADAHIKSSLACYQSLAEKGIAANVKQTQDFQWAKSKGVVAIMPDILNLRRDLYDSIKVFLKGENKLIVLGKTGFYNEEEYSMFQKGFLLKKEFGAELADLMLFDDHFKLPAMAGKYNFEVRSWLGAIKNYTAEPISEFRNYITGIRNKTGNSEVVWIPSNIDLGAWLYGNDQLSAFLYDEVKPFTERQTFEFAYKAYNVNMQTMTDGKRYLTVINNGTNKTNNVQLVNKLNKKATIFFCSDKSRVNIDISKSIEFSPRECLVLMWE